MKVKICGITDKQAALCAIENGADALGFVFAKSKREVTPKKAEEMISELPDGVLKIGVFVNEDTHMIEKIIKDVGLDMVQLHGDESPEYCAEFTVPVIKALSISTKEDLNKIDQYRCDFILLDSPAGKYRGGNGTRFDWDLLKDYDIGDKALILAGGLNEGNVIDAITAINPFMVDVSSGVETNGKKDLHKIKRFLQVTKGRLREELNK